MHLDTLLIIIKLANTPTQASRRGAETYVLDGRVSVNGNIVTELGHKVDTLKDVVLVDGKKIALPGTLV